MTSDVPGAARRAEQFVAALLVFLFFQVGYLWAGAGHTPETAWHGATWLDDQIPLVPAFILFYMLGYFFVLTPAFLLRQRRDFEAGIAVFVGMLSVAFLCFHFFPVFMNKQYATGTDFFSGLTRYQQRMDIPYNNLPSLHVALNLFAWMLIFFQAGKKALWWLPLPIFVVVSTLLVKQHLVVDVVGGVLLAACGFAAWLWLRQRRSARVMYAFALLLVIGVLLANIQRVWTGIQITTDLLAKMVGL